jgi:hypothetical protein
MPNTSELDALLRATLEHAVSEAPFYAEHLGERWREVRAVGDLHRLPLLTKALATANQERMLCGAGEPDLGSISSGTTRRDGAILRIQHTTAEDEALTRWYDEREAVEPTSGDDGGEDAPDAGVAPDDGLLLHVVNPHHGYPRPAEPGTVRILWGPYASICEHVEHALRTPCDGRRIEYLRISVNALKELTTHFLAAGVDFGAFAIREIGINAGYLTARWRYLIEHHWGAPIYDNYSLSEIASPATELDRGGWYRFTPPPLVTEVIDPHSGAPLDKGAGHLVLTPLYPFAQRQPLIRYATGDLVEIGDHPPGTPEFSFRFRGRVHQSVHRPREGDTDYLLFPTELEEIVDPQPEVARRPSAFEQVNGLGEQQVGQALYAACLDGDVVRASVGVRFNPHLFPLTAGDLREHIAAELRARHPALDAAVSRGELRLEIDLCFDRIPEGGWFVKNG